MREAGSIAGALGRLGRLGHVPVAFDGGSLGGLLRERLAGLRGFDVVDGAALELALAAVATPGGADAGDLGAAAARLPDPLPVGRAAPVAQRSRRPAPSTEPARAAVRARPSRPRDAVSAPASASVPEPESSTTGSSQASAVAVAPESSPAVSLPDLSLPARLEAATPVGPRAPVGGSAASTSAAGLSALRLDGSRTAAAPSSAPLSTPPASSFSGATDAHRRRDGRATSDPLPRRARLERAVAASPPGHSHDAAHPASAPVAGLAGLVSWWDARETAQRPADRAELVPAVTPPAAAWSVADTAHEASRTAEGAFESAPVVRLSLRAALEELLLAEARASGIEVDP